MLLPIVLPVVCRQFVDIEEASQDIIILCCEILQDLLGFWEILFISLEVKKENLKKRVYPRLDDYPSFLLKRAVFLDMLRDPLRYSHCAV